jgi:hypothetical protein
MAKTDEGSEGHIDWQSAEVDGGDLTVAIEGEVSKAWAKRAADVADRIARSPTWGAVKVKREAIEVADVPPGSEDALRHVLEGAVQQANADFAPREDEDDGPSGEDAEMTAAFRAFAERAEEPAEEPA